MRRDMDVVRLLLVSVAKAREPLDVNLLVDSRHDFEQLAYHAMLLEQAGLVKAHIVRGSDQILVAEIVELTWAGNDLLDTIQSEAVWRQVKSRLASSVGSVSVAVLKQLACSVAVSMLGLSVFADAQAALLTLRPLK